MTTPTVLCFTQDVDKPPTEFDWRNWKIHKSNFKNVILEVNAGKIQLDSDEKAALMKLRGMWNKVNVQTNVMEYFEMKDHHTLLSGTLLYVRPNEAWKKYIEEFALMLSLAQFSSQCSDEEGQQPSAGPSHS